MIAPYRFFNDFFADLIRAGIAEGSLKPVDAEIIAQAILSIAIGTLLQGLLDPGRTDWSAVAENSINAILTGVINTKEIDQ